MAAALGKLDEALESAGVLPKLEPPEALTEEQTREFAAVSGSLLGLVGVQWLGFTPLYIMCRDRRCFTFGEHNTYLLLCVVFHSTLVILYSLPLSFNRIG
jgi:hypothetical protein